MLTGGGKVPGKGERGRDEGPGQGLRRHSEVLDFILHTVGV